MIAQTINVFGTYINTPGLTNVFDSQAASTWNVSGGNLAECGFAANFAGKFNPYQRRVGQTPLDLSWTNQIPASDATHTNWWLGSTNGIPILAATNVNNSPAGQAFFIKVLVP